jgi:hypothetical protein
MLIQSCATAEGFMLLRVPVGYRSGLVDSKSTGTPEWS